MLYVLYGDNFSEARNKLRGIVDSQKEKNPDASHFRLTTQEFDEGKLEEFLGSSGLFQNKYIIVLDGLLSDEENTKIILDRLSEIAESENIFVVIEPSLKKELLSKLEKKSAKVQKFELAKKGGVEKKAFNVFALTDALGARDKKKLWVLYESALLSGLDPEEIHRVFFWQVKSMLGASVSGNALDAGLNPFVYKKTSSYARNFKDGELVALSRSLIDIYHNARRGIADFDIAMERWVLGL